MATIPHPITTPLAFKTTTVNAQVVGATDTDNLTPQVGELRFTPATQTGSWTGVSGNVVSDQSAPVWTVTIGMIQDIAASGMLRWLLSNKGKKATFTALLVTGVTATFTATISPAEIGGAPSGTPLTSTVTLAMDGDPAFT
jgi:hypothetical protein